jgi:hypothetical protein
MNFLLFRGVGPPFWSGPPLFEISDPPLMWKIYSSTPGPNGFIEKPNLEVEAHARRSGPLSREGFLSCHTGCDTGPRFFRSHPKDRPFSSLAEFRGGAEPAGVQ